MEVQRFTEHYMCDALRLATYLADIHNGTLSEGLGDVSTFPFPPRELEQIDGDVRFIRVEGEGFLAEVAFVSGQQPRTGDKFRNKSIHRVMLGEEIRKTRTEKDVTIEELSRRTGLRTHSLIRIEEGRWDIDLAQIGNILDALGVSIHLG